LLPDVALAARPGVLVLTTGLLVGLCLILVAWGGGGVPRAGRDGLLLLADNSSPKLDRTSAQAPPSRSAAVPKVEPDRQSLEGNGTACPPRVVVAAPVQTAEPPPAPLPTLEPPPAPVPPPLAVEIPLENCYAFRDAHPGEGPMMCNWKLLGLQSVVAAAFLTSAAPAAEPASEPDKTTAIVKQLGDLKAALEALDKTVRTECGGLRADVKATQIEVERLKTDMALLRQDLDAMRKQAPPTRESAYPPEARAELEQMRRAVEALHQDIEALRRQMPATRVAGFPPAEGMGRVRLVNTFPAPVTIVVNRRSYELNPGESRWTEPFRYGPFSYEVLGIQEPRTRALAANDPPFTIHVYPR
jgi:hypothetical protein